MLLYLSLLVVLVACERVIREFEVPEKRFGQMYSFGFLPGGSARVRIVSSNPTAQLAFLLCAEKEHFQLAYVCSAIEANLTRTNDAPPRAGTGVVPGTMTTNGLGSGGGGGGGGSLCQSTSLFAGNLSADLAVPSQAGTYYFDLANCNDFAIANLSFWAHAVNPGGEELSAAQIPMPIVWIVVSLLWIAVLIFGIVDAIRLRAYGTSARVALLALASLKIAAALISAAEVEHRSIRGESDDTLVLAAAVLNAALRGTALSLAVGFSSGWLLLSRKPNKPAIIVALFLGIFAATVGSSMLKTGLMMLGVEFFALVLLIGSCLWAVRSTNYTLMRFATWVPTTVRRRVPGAVSGSETDTSTEDEPPAAPAVPAAAAAPDNNPSDDAAPAQIAVVDGDAAAAGAAARGAARRRRRVPAAVEWVEVRPGERRAVVVRVAVFLALRRALIMLLGGAGVVLCASLLLAQTDDTWLVMTVTELWLMLVFFETWTAFRLIKSNIVEPPPLPAEVLVAE